MFRFVDSSDGYMEIYFFLSTFLSFSIYFFFLLKSKKIMSNVMDSVKIRDCKWETASIHRGYTQAHCCSVTKSWPSGLQQARLPCPSLSPGVCPNSYSLSW